MSAADPLFDVAGRRVLITGSGRGIGLALARGFCERGATVVLNGRSRAPLERAADEFAGLQGPVEIAPFDVTDATAVADAVAAIERDAGPIDVLVNNAGMQHRAPLEDFPDEAWSALWKTNVDSTFFVGKAVARGMIARRRGRIINICSVQTALARPTIAPYTATKGAVANLTKGMATDWAKYGLVVNAIAPGYFRTELNAALAADPAFTAWLEGRTPVGRWGNVEELIGAAVFLASNAASFVNGHVLYVDGGLTACI